MAYRLSKRVASDLFEDEFIIANLETGIYYSLQGSGIFLLKNLPANTAGDVIVKFEEIFPDQKQEVLKDLTHIWQELEKEEIIEFYESELIQKEVEIGTAFTPSVLNTYADMQDLLALDPIHEVDDSGWKKQNDK
jgi:hypothetical protein